MVVVHSNKMSLRPPTVVLGLTAVLILAGCAKSGPSGESQKALSLLQANMTEDALTLLQKRVQSDPADKSAVFLLKVVRGDSTGSELIRLADENAWVRTTMSEAVASTLVESLPPTVELKKFTEDSIEGDANEAESEASSAGLSRFLSPYTAELLEWWLKSNAGAIDDPKLRFAIFMRFGYGGATESERLRKFAKGTSGDWVDIAFWETAASLYHSDKRDEALAMVRELQKLTSAPASKSAIEHAFETWRSVKMIEVPISESGSGLEINPRKALSYTMIVKPGAIVDIQVLNSIVVRPWGREQVVQPADALYVSDIESAKFDEWWESGKRRSMFVDPQIAPYPGVRHTFPPGLRPSISVTCTSGELRFSSTLPSPRSEEVWKLRVEYSDPHT